MGVRLRFIILLLCAALCALWLVSRPTENLWADGSPTAGMETPALEVRDHPEPRAPAARIHVLEFDSRGRTSGRAADPGDSGAAEPEAIDSPSLEPLRQGRGRIRFIVEDGAGRPAAGAMVAVRSLEPGGGSGRSLTGHRGETHFRGLAAGSYAYRVRGGSPTEGISEGSLQLAEGERKDVLLRLVAAGLAITGRVLDSRGRPVEGIEVSVRRHHFASAVVESGSDDRSPRTTRSQRNGAFEIRGLAEGEYDVETRATRRFAPAKVLVRAGDDPVDLLLREGFRLFGTVTSRDGEALGRVRVGVPGRATVGVYTDERGRYALDLDGGSEAPNASQELRFSKPGYEEALRQVSPRAPDAPRGLRLDVALNPAENVVVVSGSVESERGEPVEGATVILSMRDKGPQYDDVTDADGSFSVPNVAIGAGYYLRVIAPLPFRDHADEGIRVTEDGLSLEIVLETLATGRLIGRMVDVEGNPLSGMRLWLVGASARSALPVSSDERGSFEVESAPEGSLNFDTRGSPRLRVSGLKLRPGEQAEVLLVLDAGEQEMAGRVLDERGDPVPGAQISLSWSHASGDLQSSSRRETRADSSGSFRFSQLGPGEHQLEVHAPGYRSVQEYRDVDRYAAEVEVRLDPEAP